MQIIIAAVNVRLLVVQIWSPYTTESCPYTQLHLFGQRCEFL